MLSSPSFCITPSSTCFALLLSCLNNKHLKTANPNIAPLFCRDFRSVLMSENWSYSAKACVCPAKTVDAVYYFKLLKIAFVKTEASRAVSVTPVVQDRPSAASSAATQETSSACLTGGIHKPLAPYGEVFKNTLRPNRSTRWLECQTHHVEEIDLGNGPETVCHTLREWGRRGLGPWTSWVL